MSHVVVLGSSNTDLVLSVPQLPGPGQTVLGGAFTQVGGGKGANQAVAAVRAGAKTIFVGATGNDDFGRARRAELAAEGINLTTFTQAADLPSGIALILVAQSGENQIAVAPGANYHLTPEAIEALPVGIFLERNIFVSQLETPFESVVAALRRAKSAGMKTILNPAPMDRRVSDPSILSLIDILIVNEPELAELAGQDHLRADAALPHLEALKAQGCQAVIVTLGSEGYLVSSATDLIVEPAFPVEAVDTVAAGDTFVGALAARLAEGESLAAAARWASAAAALAVTRPGAQPSIPRRAEVDAFLARVSTNEAR